MHRGADNVLRGQYDPRRSGSSLSLFSILSSWWKRLFVLTVLVTCVLLFFSHFHRQATHWLTVGRRDVGPCGANATVGAEPPRSKWPTRIAMCIPEGTLRRLQAAPDEQWRNRTEGGFLASHYLNIYLGFKNAPERYVGLAPRVEDDGALYLVRDFNRADCLGSGMPDSKVRELQDNGRLLIINDTSPIPRKGQLTLAVHHARVQRDLGQDVVAEQKELLRGLSNGNAIIVPMGISNMIASMHAHSSARVILLDELYPHIFLAHMPACEKEYFLRCFAAAVAVAHELHLHYNFTVISFTGHRGNLTATRAAWASGAPWVQLTHLDGSYNGYIELLGRATYFFAHTLETYGLPYYEALQSGVPVFGFHENVPPLLFRDMDTAVLCSMSEKPAACAYKMAHYAEHLWSRDRWDSIRREAHALYSTETWGDRLVRTLIARGDLPDSWNPPDAFDGQDRTTVSLL